MTYEDSNLNNLFWKFSLEFYAEPKVANSLITLQDELGVDVNLILCCFWSADRGFSAFSQELISDLNAIVEEWNLLVIKPLRSARVGIKSLDSGKYTQIIETIEENAKILELNAEQFEQMLIYNYLDTHGISSVLAEHDKIDVAKSNISSYLSFLKLNTRLQSEMLDGLLVCYKDFCKFE